MSGRDELEVLRAGPDIHLGNSLDSVLHLWIPGRRVRGAVPSSCDFSRMLRASCILERTPTDRADSLSRRSVGQYVTNYLNSCKILS